MIKSKTVQAIEEDRQFEARLADAYRIKCNPRITDKESLYHALYGYLPYDMPESAHGVSWYEQTQSNNAFYSSNLDHRHGSSLDHP